MLRFQKKLIVQNTNIWILPPPPNYRSSGAPGNTLPIDIRDTTKSVPSFETLLRKHYIDLTSMSIFNSDDQRPHKFVWNVTQVVLYETYYLDLVDRLSELHGGRLTYHVDRAQLPWCFNYYLSYYLA